MQTKLQDIIYVFACFLLDLVGASTFQGFKTSGFSQITVAPCLRPNLICEVVQVIRGADGKIID
jgi:hypothetical protein